MYSVSKLTQMQQIHHPSKVVVTELWLENTHDRVSSNWPKSTTVS